MRRDPADTNDALSGWLDGELDPAEAAELEAELARDPALKAELESLESVMRLLRDEGPTEAPLGFHHRVMARVEREHPETTPWWAWLRRPFGVPLEGWAIGLAAAIALLLVLPSREPPAPEGPEPDETSPAVVRLPTEPAPVVKDAAPPPPQAPEGRTGADKIRRKKVDATPAPEVIPGKVTTGEEQPGAVATVVLPPPTVPAPFTGTADGEVSVYRMLVRSEDVAVKRAVLATCSRFGTPVGMQVATMSGSRETVVCGVSPGKLAEFSATLESTGYEIDSAMPTGLLSGRDGFVRVEVTIELVGGAPQAAPPAGTNAARKAMELDAFEGKAEAN